MPLVPIHLAYCNVGGKKNIPFSASRLRLWLSKSSSLPCLFTVASLRVFANASCISLPNSSKPCTSSMAFCAPSTVSKTINAWPFALRFVFATMSMIVPYSENSSRRDSISWVTWMRSSRLRAYTLGGRG